MNIVLDDNSNRFENAIEFMNHYVSNALFFSIQWPLSRNARNWQRWKIRRAIMQTSLFFLRLTKIEGFSGLHDRPYK